MSALIALDPENLKRLLEVVDQFNKEPFPEKLTGESDEQYTARVEAARAQSLLKRLEDKFGPLPQDKV